MADASLPLEPWVKSLSPELDEPHHLAEFCRALDDETITRILSSIATRHGKTTTIGHWMVRDLIRNPKLEFLYFAHKAEFAHAQNRGFRRLYIEAGGRLQSDFSTIKEWRTPEGGGIVALSADQDVIGRGYHRIVVDDPLGSPQDADDPVIRAEVDAKIRFLTTRLHPGARVLINMSRFHPEDPIGRRVKETAQGWLHIQQPAILPSGVPLWPERWTLEALMALRNELAIDDPAERIWWAQYMGDPKPESGDLFRVPARYAELPCDPLSRTAIGIDAAYSTSKTSDWFAVCAMTSYLGRGYMRHMMRFKASEERVLAELRAAQDIYGHCPIYSYMSGPEIGTARYLAAMGIPVQVLKARYHKITRARKTIDRWNSGGLFLPNNAPWLSGFLSRVQAWRGIDGDQDDEIDAMVSCHDGLMSSGVTKPMTVGPRRM